MKTIKVLLTALVVTAFSISCSSSDDGDPTGGNIAARWNETKTVTKISGETYNAPYTQNEPGCDKDFLEFTDGGVANRVIYYKNADNVCTQDASTPAEWAKTNNTLIISDGFYGGTYTIKKLTNSELTIQTSDTTGSVTTTTTIYFSKAAM